MKKKLLITICFIWIAAVAAATVLEGKTLLSSGEFTFENHSCSGEDAVYVTENFQNKGYLYRIGGDNTVRAMTVTDTVEENSIYSAVDYEDGVYSILETKALLYGEWTDVYRIVRYSRELVPTECSMPFCLEQPGVFSGLSVEGTEIFMTVLSGDGSRAYIYQMEAGECMTPILPEVPKEKAEEPEPVTTLPCSMISECREGRYFVAASYEQGELQARLDDGSGAENFLPDKAVLKCFEEKQLSLRQGLMLWQKLLERNLLILLGGLIVLVLLTLILKNRNRVIYVAVVLEALLLFLSAAGVAFVYAGQRQARKHEYERFGHYYMQSLLAENNLEQLPFEGKDFYDSEAYRELVNRLSDYVHTSGVSEIFYDVCVMRMDDRMIVASASGRNGQRLAEVYSTAAEEMAASLTGGTLDGEAEISLAGRKYGVLGIVPDTTMTPAYVLLGITNNGSLEADSKNDLWRDMGYGAAVFLAGSILCLLILILQARDLEKLEEAMEKVAEGHSELRRPAVYGNDMSHMWSSLFEADKTIKKINYSKYRIFEAYYRFAPKNIEKILEKDSITEVTSGDMRMLQGRLVLISLKKQKGSEQGRIETLNRFLSVIEKRQEEQQGFFVSNDCNLSMLKILFLDNKGNTVQFGTDLSHDLQDDVLLAHTSVCVFLYTAQFVYGVAGTQSQNFPFLQSDEQINLEDWTEWLRDMGLRLVITEEIRDSEYTTGAVRCIGYVDGKTKDQQLKLYEVLDACPDSERRGKLRNLEKFARGLELFYRSDFYLARGVFSEILKDIPYDEISKWYLFTCEKHLNKMFGEADSYGLQK